METFGMIPYTQSLEHSIHLFIDEVRKEASRGPVRWRIALFAKDTCGWRTVVLDPGEANDIDGMLIWSMNRMARIIDAQAAVYSDETPEDGAIACVERRDATVLERHRLGRGDTHDVTEASDCVFDLLPGGPPTIGWGRQDHDDIELDCSLP